MRLRRGIGDNVRGVFRLLSKRQSRITNAVVIVIRFVYIYAPRCLARCQASSGSVLQAALTRTVPTFVFTNIEIILLGGSLRLISIKITAIVFISDIREITL